jgi:hypothetical protein
LRSGWSVVRSASPAKGRTSKKRPSPHLHKVITTIIIIIIVVVVMGVKFGLSEPGYLSGISLGYGLDDRGFESRQRLGIFLFITASRLALGPTQPPI